MNYRTQIIESIPEYFFVYDVEKQEVTFLSDSFKKFRREDLELPFLNQIRNLIHESNLQAFDDIFKNIIEDNNLMQDQDLRCSKSTGRVEWINIKIHPMVSPDKKLVAGHVVDITDKIFHLQNLVKEADELEHIVHVMAHDLRGPLGSILNLIEIQRDAIKNGDTDNGEVYLKITERIAQDMRLTINGMIELIQVKSERFQLKTMNTNITKLVKHIVRNYTFDIEHKGIELHTSLPDHDIFVKLDNIKFRLIIQNLMSNAIKFTHKGGKITVSLAQNEKNIEVKISDTGIGIPEDKQEQIFEEFTEMKRKGTKGEKSIGLGLSIVKKITEVHKGKIEVVSSPGKGTMFIVKLPIIE